MVVARLLTAPWVQAEQPLAEILILQGEMVVTGLVEMLTALVGVGRLVLTGMAEMVQAGALRQVGLVRTLVGVGVLLVPQLN
jgi:hypothetical protein